MISVEITFLFLFEKKRGHVRIIFTGDVMKEFMKKYWFYGVIGVLVLLFLLIPQETQGVDDTSSPTIQKEQEEVIEYIYVDIKGQVKNPGVYKLDQGSRLFQVINLAGGLTDDANSLLINMSILLEDQMNIYVPSIHDKEPIDVIPNEEPDDFLIDINQAGATLLETLPGIGPSTAQNIIDYRNEYGYFDTIEDIMNVPNIGEATFENIKDLITVEE